MRERDQVTIERGRTESSPSEPRYMNAGQRSEMVVVMSRVREKCKKTREHEKRQRTHRDQQQGGGGGWKRGKRLLTPTINLLFPSEATLLASSSPDTFRSAFNVSGEIFY